MRFSFAHLIENDCERHARLVDFADCNGVIALHCAPQLALLSEQPLLERLVFWWIRFGVECIPGATRGGLKGVGLNRFLHGCNQEFVSCMMMRQQASSEPSWHMSSLPYRPRGELEAEMLAANARHDDPADIAVQARKSRG